MSFNPWPFVWAQWRAQSRLAGLTLVLVACAVAIGVAVMAQERALRQGSARAADDFDLLLGAAGSATQLVLTTVYLQPQVVPLLSAERLQAISEAKGLLYAAPIAFGDRWLGHPIVGTTAAWATLGGTIAPVAGRMFGRRGEALLGADVPLALGDRLHPTHGSADPDARPDADHLALAYTVVGRLPRRHTVWDRAILVPVEDVWRTHHLPDGHASSDGSRIGPPWATEHLSGVPAVVVKPASVADAYRLRAQFKGQGTQALFPAEVLNDLYLTLGQVRDLMALMALCTQVLVVLAVLLAVWMSLSARRRQFAVLQAVGAGWAYVWTVIWLEVTGLLVLGAALGLGLGLAWAQLLSIWLGQRLGFTLPVALGWAELRGVAVLLLCCALGVGIVALALSRRAPMADLSAP